MGRKTATEAARPGAGLRLALASIAVLCAALHSRQLFGGATSVLRDHLVYTWPERKILADALRAGRIPEWNDLVAFGTQFAASSANGVTYPLLWLVALLPLPLSLDLVVALHVLLSGIGTALFARRLGASALGAAFAGAAFMACGYVESIAPNKVFAATAWLPWIAWATDRAVREEGDRVRAAAVLAAMVGAQILAGDPASCITAAVVALVVALSRSPRPGQGLPWLASAYAAALILGAAGLLPGLALLPHTTREMIGPLEGELWSLHPWRLLELVWPGVLGNPADPRYNLAELLARSGGTALDPSWSLSAYLGAPVLALAAVAAIARRPGSRGIWIGVGVLLLLALGAYTPLYPLFRALFPPERLIRYPEKHLVGALCLLCALGGAGISDLARASRAAPWVFGTAIACLAVPLMLLSILWPALTDRLGPAASAMVPPLDVEGAFILSLRSGVVSAAAAVVTSWLLFTSTRPRLGRMAGPLAVAVHVVHAAWEGWAIGPVAPRADLVRRPALLRSALAVPGQPPPRILRSPLLDADIPPERQGAYRHETLYLDSAGRFGFAAVPGFEGWRSREFAALWARAGPVSLQAFLSLYAIEYVALPSALRERIFPSDRRAARKGPVPGPAQGAVADLVLASIPDTGSGSVAWTLMPAEGVRPRAFVAPRWRWVEADEAIGRTFSPARLADPALVLLTGSGPSSPAERDGLPLSPCRIDGYVAERILLACDSPAGGYVVFADENAPGWTARVDGAEAGVVTADVLLRAVAVSPGPHRIELTYRTPLLRAGAAISCAGWCALLVLFWRRRSADVSSEESGPPSSGSAQRAA